MMKNDFIWGTASAAFQVEGATHEDGRGPSIWDAFTQIPGKILGGANADVACDHYHRMEEDVEILKTLGVNGYRFSIAWPRIFPGGPDKVNEAGLAFYDRLIDALLKNGIEPFPTLYHWDLPLWSLMEEDAWLNRKTAERFRDYADLCFRHFGDRVRHWTTFNESWCTAVLGYGLGAFAPGRCDSDLPYRAAHHLLLAHGMAAQAFRKGGYAGSIGIANNCDWREPLTDSEEDRMAAERALEFFYGWFTDPLFTGEYPEVMRQRLGKRLPEFTVEEKKLLIGSADFLGLNHYTTLNVSANPPKDYQGLGASGNGGMIDDQQVYLTPIPGVPVTDMGWGVVPWGLRKMLNWIAGRYPGTPIYITENGCSAPEPDVASARNDLMRQDFITRYTAEALKARDQDHVPLAGYFCWTLMDNFEWTSGYERHLGLIRCTPEDRTRILKGSFHTYQELIRNNR